MEKETKKELETAAYAAKYIVMEKFGRTFNGNKEGLIKDLQENIEWHVSPPRRRRAP